MSIAIQLCTVQRYTTSPFLSYQQLLCKTYFYFFSQLFLFYKKDSHTKNKQLPIYLTVFITYFSKKLGFLKHIFQPPPSHPPPHFYYIKTKKKTLQCKNRYIFKKLAAHNSSAWLAYYINSKLQKIFFLQKLSYYIRLARQSYYVLLAF